MAVGEKEGKTPRRDRRGARGGRDRQLLGLGGDHVPFLGQLEIFWL
jgi:hypothetical protein